MVNLVTLWKEGALSQNSWADVSTRTAFKSHFPFGPDGYGQYVLDNWMKVMNDAINRDEFMVCWRGELPLNGYEPPRQEI